MIYVNVNGVILTLGQIEAAAERASEVVDFSEGANVVEFVVGDLIAALASIIREYEEKLTNET